MRGHENIGQDNAAVTQARQAIGNGESYTRQVVSMSNCNITKIVHVGRLPCESENQTLC